MRKAAVESTQKVGEWINNATKIVFSRTRKDVTRQGSRVIPTSPSRRSEH